MNNSITATETHIKSQKEVAEEEAISKKDPSLMTGLWIIYVYRYIINAFLNAPFLVIKYWNWKTFNEIHLYTWRTYSWTW